MLDLDLDGKYTQLCQLNSIKDARFNIVYLLQEVKDFNLRNKLEILLNINP